MARIAILCLALFAFAAVSAQNVPVTPQRANGPCGAQNIKDAIELALRNREELADFRRLVDAANDIGSTAKPTEVKYTIFAPTNGALAAIADVDDLVSDPTGNRAEINLLVRTHITTAGAFPTKALRDSQRLQTADPETTTTVEVDKDTGRPLITVRGPRDADGNANVIDPRNIRVCKSFMHAINEALQPRDPTA